MVIKEVGKVTRRARSKPNVRGELSREVILDAAERHFGDLGYRGASTAAIAADAGISDPGLLHHFGSKDGLLLALLNRRYSRDNEKLRAGMHLSKEQISETLLSIVKENKTQEGEVKLTMVLLAEAISPQNPAHVYFQMRYILARTIMKRHIDNLRSDGVLRDDIDPSALSSLILAVFDGLQLQWLLDPAIDMEAAVRVFDTLLNGAMRSDGAGKGSTE